MAEVPPKMQIHEAQVRNKFQALSEAKKADKEIQIDASEEHSRSLTEAITKPKAKSQHPPETRRKGNHHQLKFRGKPSHKHQ
ncbi:hypothetical protein JTB14_036408 [Gonioctena quinquepunctata]|nr:hypothetical protein JTB14_036408 [Gonioctena quinquepunctata]